MITIQGDSIQKRILVDGVWYICNLSHRENVEYWSVANSGAQKVADELKRNGMVVLAVRNGVPTSFIEVDRTKYNFLGETYNLNQCEDNIFDWMADSKVGDFTYYYKNIVFHGKDACYSAYSTDLSNYIAV